MLANLDSFTPSSDNPWDKSSAGHLLRRTGHLGSSAEITSILNQDPGAAVDQLVDTALQMPVPDPILISSVNPPGDDASQEVKTAFSDANTEAATEYQRDILRRSCSDGLRERMTYLWSNHFVVAQSKYRLMGYGDRYFRTIRKNALGNLKDFVYDIGRDPAMLVYLDGDDNVKGTVNENFGRELLELFSIGIGNYTQFDILETSRALTGWVDSPQGYDSFFVPERFDDGSKIIFGQEGNWGYDDVIDIIFAEKAWEAAHFACTKIYKLFVHARPNEDVVNAMSQLMIDNNFEIAPVVSSLLKSAHFFNRGFHGSRIKGPLELFQSLVFLIRPPITNSTLLDYGRVRTRGWGQHLLNPPNVKGHPEGQVWISSGKLIDRWQFTARMIRQFGLDIPEILTWSEDNTNPYTFAIDVAKKVVGYPLEEDELSMMGDILLGGAPDYEWSANGPNTEVMIRQLINHLVQLPAFQLM